jgi:hypothetical protein
MVGFGTRRQLSAPAASGGGGSLRLKRMSATPGREGKRPATQTWGSSMSATLGPREAAQDLRYCRHAACLQRSMDSSEVVTRDGHAERSRSSGPTAGHHIRASQHARASSCRTGLPLAWLRSWRVDFPTSVREISPPDGKHVRDAGPKHQLESSLCSLGQDIRLQSLRKSPVRQSRVFKCPLVSSHLNGPNS